MTKKCAGCGFAPQDEANFCPKCGRPLKQDIMGEPSEFTRSVDAEKKPKKRYEMIAEALKHDPDDFEANQALLFLGRLHEPMRGRDIDFSIVKCHLLTIYDEPEKLAEGQLEAKHEELFGGELLLRVKALSGDEQAFMAHYLRRLAREYIDLFIRGSSRYSTLAFGLPRSAESTARMCRAPVLAMIERAEQDDLLDIETRSLLTDALRQGFEKVFTGYPLYGE